MRSDKVSAACAALPNTYGSATIDITIPSTGTYRIWSRIKASDTTNNSYYLELETQNGATNIICGVRVGDGGITANTWTWVDYKDGAVGAKIDATLNQGVYKVRMVGREPGVRLDKVMFIADPNCTPQGTGDINHCNVDTGNPTGTDILVPKNGDILSGTQAVITSDPRDDSGISKVEYYANNQLMGTSTSRTGYGWLIFWDTTKVVNGSYSLKARAYDTSSPAKTAESPLVNITVQNGSGPDTTSPSIPTNVTSGNVTHNSLTLNWSASTDNVAVAGYKIYRNGTQISTATTITFTDTTVLPVTSYSYAVSAYDTAGNNSNLSTAHTVTTSAAPDITPPPAPTLSGTAASATQINLSWNTVTDPSGIKHYLVQRNGVTLAIVTNTVYYDTAVQPSTTYNYRVRAVDNANNTSVASNQISVTTPSLPDTMPPTAPTNVSAVVLSSSQVNINWSASTDNVAVAGYEVYRNDIKVSETASSVRSFGDATVAAGTTYIYTVKAFDAAGNFSPASNQAQVTTPQESDKQGDLNNDNQVNGLDLSLLLSNWRQTGQNTADINQDGIVNGLDLSLLLDNWRR